MKRIIIQILILVSGISLTAWAEVNNEITPESILRKGLEVAKQVHSAKYDLTKKFFFKPEDDFYIDEESYKVIESEYTPDTTGVGAFVVFKEDGSFNNAYQGDSLIKLDRTNTYLYITDMTQYKDFRRISPKFFHRVRNLCDYLLTTDTRKEITLEETDSTWTVDAKVYGMMQVIFIGYPREMMSEPYAVSHFTVTFDKSTMLPTSTSYLSSWPQWKYIEEVTDVIINPFETESFDIHDYLLGYSRGTDKEKRARLRAQRKEEMDRISSGNLPSDTLTLVDNGTISLSDGKDSIKIVILVSARCGISPYGCKILNNILKNHPDIFAFGVLLENKAQPEAAKLMKQRFETEFPLAQDNGKFYNFFDSQGGSPIFIIIDKQGRVRGKMVGADWQHPEKTEADILEFVEKARTPAE